MISYKKFYGLTFLDAGKQKCQIPYHEKRPLLAGINDLMTFDILTF